MMTFPPILARRPELMALAVLSSLFVSLGVPARAQTVTVTELNPTGFDASYGYGISGATQVGYGYGSVGQHALLWTNTQESVVDLNPVGFFQSEAMGVSGPTQVGDGYTNGVNSAGHALLWHGTAASVVDLNPVGYNHSSALGVSGQTQVGFGGNGVEHALLWQGTAASVVDLNPAGLTSSAAFAADGESQVGLGMDAQGDEHALLWHGTAASAIDLNPVGYDYSSAVGVSGDTQVGGGSGPATGNEQHALLWRGTADSVVDLSSAGFAVSQATGIADGVTVGYGESAADSGNTHALLWTGTADSVVDLNIFLPAGYSFESQAFGVSRTGNVVDIVGIGNDTSDKAHAFLWHVTYPTRPVLAHLDPASRTQGRGDFTLTVNGSGFSPDSHITWNGAAQTTTFVSFFEMTAQIPASLIATAGTASVAVSTPGASTSSTRIETINPRPTLSSLSPASKRAGSATFTLTAVGTGLLPRSIVKWNGMELVTTYVSAAKLTAQVPASLLTKLGAAQVLVTTPQVATTTPQTFTITP